MRISIAIVFAYFAWSLKRRPLKENAGETMEVSEVDKWFAKPKDQKAIK